MERSRSRSRQRQEQLPAHGPKSEGNFNRYHDILGRPWCHPNNPTQSPEPHVDNDTIEWLYDIIWVTYEYAGRKLDEQPTQEQAAKERFMFSEELHSMYDDFLANTWKIPFRRCTFIRPTPAYKNDSMMVVFDQQTYEGENDCAYILHWHEPQKRAIFRMAWRVKFPYGYWRSTFGTKKYSELVAHERRPPRNSVLLPRNYFNVLDPNRN